MTHADDRQTTPRASGKRKRRRLNERRLERKLVNLFDTLFSRRSGGWAENFEDAGVLTGNRGVVISVGSKRR